MAAEVQQPTRTFSIQLLLLAGLVAQLLSIVPLWGHESENAAILGRYSKGYALFLVFHGIVAVGWLTLTIWRNRSENVLKRLPPRILYGVALVTGLALAAIWLTSVEAVIKQYLSLTWLIAIFVLVRSLPDRPVIFRRWPLALAPLSLLLLFVMYVGVLADRRFEPDEALWADSSVALFTAGGMYGRTIDGPPMLIEPGRGWISAGYGWALYHIAFDLSVGRTWVFVAYLIAFAGIGAVTSRLHGWRTGLVAIFVAILSLTFIPHLIYRPNNQIPAVAIFIMFFALQARHSKRQLSAGIWHFLCGLLATLSLQVHASGVIFAVAFSLFYLLDFAMVSYRQHKLADLRPLVIFGLGALLGTLIYVQFNIQPAGGLGPFLQRLAAERGAYHGLLPSWQRFFHWDNSLIELFLVLLGAFYLLWRRQKADRPFIQMFLLILLAATFLDTQGYLLTFNAFFVITIAIFLDGGFGSPAIPGLQNRQSLLATGAVLFVLTLQMYGSFLSNPAIGDWFRTGQLPPFLYKAIVPVLEPYLRPDDTIVSTHELIWGFPDAHIISHTTASIHIYGKLAVQNGPFDSEVAVWEDVSPTLIIFIEHEMHFDPGLKEYMALHHFQVCAETEFMDRDIRIYRTACP